MLEELLGSRSKVRILRALVLEGPAGLTTDDLVRFTGQSTGTIVPAIRQLVANGIVAMRRESSTKRFIIAQGHSDAQAITRLFHDEAARIDRWIHSAVRRVAKGRLRYVAWLFDQDIHIAPGHFDTHARAGIDTKPHAHAITVLAIGDTKEDWHKSLIDALSEPTSTRVVALDVDEAKDMVRSGDRGIADMIRRARVAHADEEWLVKQRNAAARPSVGAMDGRADLRSGATRPAMPGRAIRRSADSA